jgi:hypothetical protein
MTIQNVKKLLCEVFQLTEEKKDPCFCYMLYVDKKDEKDFIDLQKDLKLEGKLILSGHFHATVRYVKKEDYQPFLDYLKTLNLPELHGECVEFAIYGKDKDTLVIELDGEELHDWFKKINKWLIDNGYPDSDYPTYKPHISLTELAGIEKPEWKPEYKKKITFKLHIVTKTNYEEVFRERVK